MMAVRLAEENCPPQQSCAVVYHQPRFTNEETEAAMATELSQGHRLELGCVASGALLHSCRLLWTVAGSPLSLHPVCLGRGPHPLGRELLALTAFTSNAMGDKTHSVYTERKGAAV